MRPVVFSAFTPAAVLAATQSKLEQCLSEIWWAPSPGIPSPFEQRYEGFGVEMAVAVLNLFQVSFLFTTFGGIFAHLIGNTGAWFYRKNCY
jgi:hypothetical protein